MNSRVEENRETIDSLTGIRVENKGDAAITTVLMDISKSLAIISDSLETMSRIGNIHCVTCKHNDKKRGCVTCHDHSEWEPKEG